MLIDPDAALLVAPDARLIEPKALRIRNTSDRHQHRIGLEPFHSAALRSLRCSPCTDVGRFSAPLTLEESLKAKPCRVRRRWNCLASSRSMPGSMRSKYSTTVTFAPSLLHTDPSSRPMTPAPTTTRCFGTFSKLNAPVDVTICFSSMSMPLSRAASEPVAMTMDLACSVSFAPASPLTSTSPALTMRAVPRCAVILFFLNRKSMPLVFPSMASCLNAIIWLRLILGSPMPIPIFAKACFASISRSDAWSSAFEGMQPILRHVPPCVGPFLHHADLHAELRCPDRAYITARSGADDEKSYWAISVFALWNYNSRMSRCGSSSDSFTRTRNVTASLPSTMR